MSADQAPSKTRAEDYEPRTVRVPTRVFLLYSLACGAAAGIVVAAIERISGVSLPLSLIGTLGTLMCALLLAARRRRTTGDGE